MRAPDQIFTNVTASVLLTITVFSFMSMLHADLSVWQKLLLADILFSVVFIGLQASSTHLTDLRLTTEAGRCAWLS